MERTPRAPSCPRCGMDDAMIQGEDGEWTCHHTHVIDNPPPKFPAIAIEHLVTVVCETFVEQLSEMSSIQFLDVESGSKVTLEDWYMKNMSDEDRYQFSEAILDRIEKDMKIMRESVPMYPDEGTADKHFNEETLK